MPSLTHPRALIEAGFGNARNIQAWDAIAQRYAIAVPQELAELINRKDPQDPIARQFLPDARELDHHPDELADPIGDEQKSPLAGLVHRYPDRVLIKLTASCAVYCRFCFRRESVGPGSKKLEEGDFAAILDYIRNHKEIWEVVLTGGDPLTLSPARLARVTQALASIDHVHVLRWHTRLPVAAPELVTPDRISALLNGHGKAVYIALHANHPRELTPASRAACGRLIAAGAVMISQSVLLKGVNNDPDILEALMRAFVETRVKPYYLHHPDLAPGTSHFRVTIAEGQALMRALRQRLSGLAMPNYMLDLPGARGKVPIGPSYIQPEGSHYQTTDLAGESFPYKDILLPS